MTEFKKGTIVQIPAVLVDKTDFATVESGVAASDVTLALYGLKQGVSDLASTITVTKAARDIRSGIIQVTLETDETDDHDTFVLAITHASCAQQIIPFTVVNQTNSDLHSLITNVDSQLTITDAAVDSTLSTLNSHIVIHSDYMSNMLSRVPKAVATQSLLSDVESNLRSLVVVADAAIDAVQVAVDSQYSDLLSTVGSQFAALSGASHLSNIGSAVWGQKYTAHSAPSTFGSLASDIYSKAGGGLVASDVSDIASAVWSEKWRVHSLASSFGSAFSSLWTSADAAASRALLNQSTVNNIDSQLTVTDAAIDSQFTIVSGVVDNNASKLSYLSNLQSNMSNVVSDIQSRVVVLSGASHLSNIGSAVWGQKYNAHSNLSTFGSLMSDAYSAAAAATAPTAAAVASQVWSNYGSQVGASPSQVYSQLQSQITIVDGVVDGIQVAVDSQFAVLSGASHLSNIGSAVWGQKYTAHSAPSTFGSLASDIYSKAGGGLVPSDVSDIASAVWRQVVSDHTAQAGSFGSLFSDIHSRAGVGAGAITTSNISDIASRVWSEKWRVHSLASSFGSAFSNLWTSADAGASRALLNQSTVNNIDSQLTVTDTTITNIDSQLLVVASDTSTILSTVNVMSDVLSDTQSRVVVLSGASHLSNIGSAVWGQKYNAHSAASTFGSLLSDTYSAAGAGGATTSAIAEDVWSRYGAKVGQSASKVFSHVSNYLSQLSDIVSDIDSQLTLTDTAVDQVNSRALVNQSTVNNIDSQLTVTDTTVTNIDSQLTVTDTAVDQVNSRALVNQSTVNNIDSQLTVTDSVVDAILTKLPNRPTKNTALANFQFLLVNSTDHVTPETGVSVTAERSIDGLAFGACANAVAELAAGIYTISLAASDLNGDVITLKFSGALADTRYVTIVTQTA